MRFFQSFGNSPHTKPGTFSIVSFLAQMLLGQCPHGAYLPSTRLSRTKSCLARIILGQCPLGAYLPSIQLTLPERIGWGSLEYFGSWFLTGSILASIPAWENNFGSPPLRDAESFYPDIVPRRWGNYFSFSKPCETCTMIIYNKAFNTKISFKTKVSHMCISVQSHFI